MKRLIFVLCLSMVAAVHAVAQFPLQPGEAVLTCFSDNNANSPVVAVFDIRSQTGAPMAPNNWAPPAVHLPQWNLSNVKREVFGIAIDTATPVPWLVATLLLVGGFFVFRRTWSLIAAAWQRASAEAMLEHASTTR